VKHVTIWVRYQFTVDDIVGILLHRWNRYGGEFSLPQTYEEITAALEHYAEHNGHQDPWLSLSRKSISTIKRVEIVQPLAVQFIRNYHCPPNARKELSCPIPPPVQSTE